MEQKDQEQFRAERLAAASHKVRKESMQVNAEFAAIEQDLDAKPEAIGSEPIDPVYEL